MMEMKIGRWKNLTKFSMVLFIVLLMCFAMSCSGMAPQNEADYTQYDANGSYIVKMDDIFFFWSVDEDKNYSLTRYDDVSGEKQIIDVYSHEQMNITRLFAVGDKIYYGKKSDVDDGYLYIYSVDTSDPDNLTPVAKGKIKGILKNEGEYVEPKGGELKIFEFDEDIYVLMDKRIYKLSNQQSTEVMSDVNSLFWSECVYYALSDNSYGICASSSFFRSPKEVVSAKMIESFNAENTVAGSQSCVRNIIADGDDIYFLAADPMGEILKSDSYGNVGFATPDSVTMRFCKYGNYLYYVNKRSDRGFCLCRTAVQTLKEDVLLKNVYTYSIYDDKIYYFLRGNFTPGGIHVYDINSGTDGLLIDE